MSTLGINVGSRKAEMSPRIVSKKGEAAKWRRDHPDQGNKLHAEGRTDGMDGTKQSFHVKLNYLVNTRM